MLLVRKVMGRMLILLGFMKLHQHLAREAELVEVRQAELKSGCKIKYVRQGEGGLTIVGSPMDFQIDSTSHLKSGTFIECSGGVSIGKYFHVGRGLTVFSTNHNWRSRDLIPYDEKDIRRRVMIGDAVWCGANVTIAPGATVGNGAILSTGAVIFGNIPECAIVRGNPAQVIGYRDIELFKKLSREGRFS